MKDGKITEGSAWIVPAEMYQPIRQDAVLIGAAKDKPAAQALMKYLASDKVKAFHQDLRLRSVNPSSTKRDEQNAVAGGGMPAVSLHFIFHPRFPTSENMLTDSDPRPSG